MTTTTLKVALIGPKTSGKTRIANHLAGLTAAAEVKYEPTVGVRILQFNREIEQKGEEVKLNVELWDCSGDSKYEPCWPAIMAELHGIAVVFDPTSKQQANDVRVWCEWFCKNANLTDGQCVIFAHGALPPTTHKPLNVKAGVRQVIVPIVNVNVGMKTTAIARGGAASSGMDDDDNPLPAVPVRRDPSSAELEFNKFLSMVYPHHNEVKAASAIISSVEAGSRGLASDPSGGDDIDDIPDI